MAGGSPIAHLPEVSGAVSLEEDRLAALLAPHTVEVRICSAAGIRKRDLAAADMRQSSTVADLAAGTLEAATSGAAIRTAAEVMGVAGSITGEFAVAPPCHAERSSEGSAASLVAESKHPYGHDAACRTAGHTLLMRPTYT